VSDWPILPPEHDRPPAGTARCWRIVCREIGDAVRDRLAAILSEEERGRAGRFVRDSDRLSFTAAHGGLRLLLAASLNREPRQFTFVQNAYGKPALPDRNDLHFNMSHSGGIVLIALASIEIGADVEKIRPLPDRDEIVRRFLHPGEAADMAGVGDGEAQHMFFRCWSRKEAVVKALGRGMSLDLNKYRVAARLDAAPALLELDGEADPAAWSVIDLDRPGPDHVGAIAARAKPLGVSCRTLALGA